MKSAGHFAFQKIGLSLILLLHFAALAKPLPGQSIDDYLISSEDEFFNNGADYLVVSHDNFLPALLPLLNWRAQQGLEVKAVPLSFIDSTVSGTNLRTESIKKVISYANQNWHPNPRFVLLVGDAHENDAAKNFCPAPRRPLFGNWCSSCPDSFYTSDNWYVELSDTAYLPTLAIGRLPVKTPDETAIIVRKILNYETNVRNGFYSRKVAIISTMEYFLAPETVVTGFSGSGLELQVLRSDSLSSEKMRERIIQAFNSGPWFMFVFSHAYFFDRIWFGLCAQNQDSIIFSASDLLQLTNEKHHPFILTFG